MDENNINELLLNGQETQPEDSSFEDSSAENGKKLIFYCDALNDNEVNNIIKDEKPELITLFGLNDVGKTTFVGSLFHIMFSGEEIDNYIFVDSETFIGFEDRVYNRRCNEKGESNQPRTGRLENAFLSMTLLNRKTNKVREIVFSDRAGELYRDYKTKPDVLAKDKTLSRSDRILIFLDASSFKGREYSDMKDDIQTLYRQLTNSGKIPHNAIKYLVFNKYDTVEEQSDTVFLDHKGALTNMVMETFGTDNMKEFCISSKDVEDDGLNCLVHELITPLPSDGGKTELDWVKEGIKENK